MKFNKLFHSANLASLALATITLSSCGEKNDSEPVLRFSAIPDENTTAQAQQYAPVSEWMEKTLGVKVEFVPAASYADSVDKFSTGDIQLAWFGGVSGVQARDAVKGSNAIVAGAKDLAFKSYFIAHESTGLEKSADFPTAIKGLTFTFGSNSSTSGCIMPSHFIIQNTQMKPDAYFSKIGYSGAHDKTAMTVQDGTFQVGAMSFSAYERMVKQGKIDPRKCRVIWETPLYADYNFTASAKLDEMFGEGFTDKLKQALLSCDDPAVLKAFTRKKFVEVENSTFQGIADVMKSL